MSDKELVPVTPGQNLPEHLKNVTGREGLENVTREDMVLPRLSICQSMSPQRKRSDGKYIAGLDDGHLFNTVTEENYGEKVFFIPVIYNKSRILFRPLEEGGGILCQSANGINGGTMSPTCASCPNSQFQGGGNDRKPPSCTEFLNFPVLLMPSKQLMVASFKSAALKRARTWLTRMNMGDRPIFSAVYEMATKEEQGKKGPYFAPLFRFSRWTTAEEFEFARSEYNSLKGKTIKTDETVAEEAHDNEDIPF